MCFGTDAMHYALAFLCHKYKWHFKSLETSLEGYRNSGKSYVSNKQAAR